AAETGGAPDSDVEAILAAAAHVVDETIHQHRYVPAPMETRGIVARWDPAGGNLRVWASTQNPHELRGFFSRYLGLAEHRVRVTMDDVGGGFGQKAFAMREEVCTVLAAYALARPVKWIEDRYENLHAASSARIERARVRMGIDSDGTIL